MNVSVLPQGGGFVQCPAILWLTEVQLGDHVRWARQIRIEKREREI